MPALLGRRGWLICSAGCLHAVAVDVPYTGLLAHWLPRRLTNRGAAGRLRGEKMSVRATPVCARYHHPPLLSFYFFFSFSPQPQGMLCPIYRPGESVYEYVYVCLCVARGSFQWRQKRGSVCSSIPAAVEVAPFGNLISPSRCVPGRAQPRLRYKADAS